MYWTRFITWVIGRENIWARICKTLVIAFILNFLFGVAFFYAERGVQEGLGVQDSVWWALVTMTTVGYGDFYPQTFIGRYVIAYPCFIVGVGILGYLLGILAEGVLEHTSRKRRGLMKIKDQNHIIICNFPGEDKILQLVEEFRAHKDYEYCTYVLVTEEFDELPDSLNELKIRFVKGNPMSEEVLRKANVDECEGVLVLAQDPLDDNSDAQTFVIGTIVGRIEKEVDRDINVVVEQIDKSNGQMMMRAGTDGVVVKSGISDNLIVQEYLNPGIYEVFKQLTSNSVGSQFYIFNTDLEGLKIVDIQTTMVQHTANLQLVGIINGDGCRLNPPKEQSIAKHDRLIVLAENPDDFCDIEREILNSKS